MKKPPFAVDALREVLSFDPETGHLNWLQPRSLKLKPGDRAGSIGKNGRREINILGYRLLAHHIAWYHYYGEWPTDYVRQRNGDYDDCSIANLYQQTPLEAGLTRALPSTNTSGYRGVSRDKRSGRWQATIRRKYKQMHLGLFDTPEEASAAFLEADKAFRPDVSLEEIEAKAHELSIQRRQKALWSVTLREAGGVTGWTDEAAFLADIGEPPGARYSLLPADTSKLIGPGNYQWVLPRHARFAMETLEGRRAYDQHRREVNPAAFRGNDLRKNFNLSLTEYQAMHDAQGGVCAICQKPETATRNGKPRWLAVDHDHATGKIRELLCSACNVILGYSNDDPAILRAAAAYLERHQTLEDEERVA